MTGNNTITGTSIFNTISAPFMASSTTYITTSSLIWPHKLHYKCAYCDTIHENNYGVCDRCGAPLGVAICIEK